MDKGAGRFTVRPADPRRARLLGERLGLRYLTAQLLINRGIKDEPEARKYLDPRLADLRPPEGAQPMAGFGAAVERLKRAVIDRETIGIFGDYDVDGVTTCALLTDFLNRAGATVSPRVARRGDGYGFGKGDAYDLTSVGCSLIVTGDCGTSDHETLRLCKSMGVEVVIVDHHQVPEGLCEALALLNPHQPGCEFPFKGLASVGVAFYLAGALRTRLRAAGWPHLPDLRDFLDLVAIGTIADLAPLAEENRVLVHAGLRELKRCQRPGLRALCEIVGLDEGPSSASDVAFRLAPRLNAPGRLGDATEALSLLIETEQRRARTHAETCNDMNTRRQEVQEVVLREAREQVEQQLRQYKGTETTEPEVLVVGGRGWHAGVVGIIAAKLVDLYSRPAVVIAFDEEVGRGSARSAHQFHMYQGLQAASSLLLRYGGHAAAAGLSIHESNVDELRKMLCDSYRRQLGAQPPLRDTTVDATVSLEEVDERLAYEISLLEPFGIGNQEPLLLVRDAEVVRHKVVGSGHLQVTLRSGAAMRDAIGFGLGHRANELLAGVRLHAAFVPEIDTHRGLRRVRLRLRDLAVANS